MRRAGGFSLLELVAVLSIFALVALIGVQVIQATVRTSDRLTAISEASGRLALGLGLLRQDLNAAVPRGFTPPGGGEQPALTVRQGAGFSLSVGGLARLDPGATGFGRVTWRYEPSTGRVLRQVWTSLTPGGRPPPETVVLQDVRRFELASYAVQGGWRPGFASDPREIALLPLGLRVRLDHARAEAVETVVSLR
ncbi:MAG: prepilin-type N-terminal cleavage/methylation domain-containing protein [Rhodobacteraceae bacterium]|nr:prepilin-type N-terminal cleavage/methylation domain-containing protein [Paracoccaceae bacterium]